MLFPPGYLSTQSLKNMRAVRRPAIQGGKVTIEGLMETGIFLCGSPDTVRQEAGREPPRAGLPELPRGAAIRDLAARSHREELRLFAREVLPALQALTDKEYARHGGRSRRIEEEQHGAT